MKKALLLTLITFLIASVSNAQLVGKFAKKGQWEVGGSIGFSSVTPVDNGNTEDATTFVTFAPNASYFVSDGFEVGVIVDVQYMKPSSGSSTTDYTLYLAPAYNFKTESMFYPYLQGQLGFTGLSGSVSRSGLAWAVEGGVKANVVQHVLVKAALNYSQLTRNQSGSGSRNGWNMINFMAGFGVYF